MSLVRLFGDDMLRDPFFERSLQSLWPNMPAHALTSGSQEVMSWQPRCDVSESATDIKICANLPGVKKEDIQLDVDEEGRFMTIKGKLTRLSDKDETKEGRQYHYVERSCGNFRRSFQLPYNVDTKAIAANYEDGVLNVTIPKKEQTPKTQRIEITATPSAGKTVDVQEKQKTEQ